MGTGGNAFGPLAWLRLPRGLTGFTPPQSGWRWQGLQGQRARRQQRGLSLLAGKRLALVKSRIGCCLETTVPTTIPYHPHGEEPPATTLLQAGGRQASGPLHGSALVPIWLCWSLWFPSFQLGSGRSRRLRVRAQEGDVVALGQPEWSRRPP